MAFSTERAPRRLAVRGAMKIPGMVASMEASELCGSLAPIHERPTKAPLECVLVDLCAIEEVRWIFAAARQRRPYEVWKHHRNPPLLFLSPS